MSAVIKTTTPFINKELLLGALEKVGCQFTMSGGDIITDREDYYGRQKFSWRQGRYVFLHDSSADIGAAYFRGGYPWGNIKNQAYKSVSQFLASVEQEYQLLYQQKEDEEEKVRLEKERQEYVEKQRAAIMERAKEQGYTIKEKNVKGKIKLVLTRNTY